MKFRDFFLSCGYKDVHQLGVFFLMSYVFRSIERYYYFDFYVLDCKHYMSISSNGRHIYFQIDTDYFNSLYLLHMDSFCIECISNLW